MALYEHVFLVRQDASPQEVEALAEQMKSIIESGGGKIAKTENWGLRPLAFRINKNRKAHYTLLNIDAPSSAVAEMERQMKINEDILRFLTLRVEELEEGPSAIMRRQERDDRFERDGRDGDRRPFRRPREAEGEVEIDAEIPV